MPFGLRPVNTGKPAIINSTLRDRSLSRDQGGSCGREYERHRRYGEDPQSWDLQGWYPEYLEPRSLDQEPSNRLAQSLETSSRQLHFLHHNFG
jgi:hypothetical protein